MIPLFDKICRKILASYGRQDDRFGMDSGKSLLFVADFERRIQRAQAEPAQEEFLREFLGDVVAHCPLAVLTRIATCVLDVRRNEMRSASEQN